MSTDREELAEVLWDAAQSTDLRPDRTTWKMLMNCAEMDVSDYREIRELYYTEADAVLSSTWLTEHDRAVAERAWAEGHRAPLDSYHWEKNPKRPGFRFSVDDPTPNPYTPAIPEEGQR
ncbi:hypothetical protein [Subtercola vilae]|uniref:Uncharacterized protein n=1 Tax=Subtercola vilae TaxID=2056433 RepID=A0A4T2B590_9MICO|nr:hypothetical protein [Subtercola vilae]TIH26033.1 hypothetical protein D4765_19085 [Subtercola vilae]